MECSYSVAWWGDEFLRLPQLSRDLGVWLAGAPGYQVLYDSYDPDYFRLAYLANSLDITQIMNQIGEGELHFSCKPFRWSWAGQETITLTAPGSLYNPEGITAEPYWKLYGSGDITLNIGSQGWILKGVEEYIELDSEMMNAYKDTLPLNDRMQGDGFPLLAPGWNQLSWEGNLQKLELKPRWKTL